MTFKLDENLPAELVGEMGAAGHGADTVASEGMAGISDGDLLQALRPEDRILLTLDKGIANIHLYPPGACSGIVLFRPDSMGRGEVFRFVQRHLGEVLKLNLKRPAGRGDTPSN